MQIVPSMRLFVRPPEYPRTQEFCSVAKNKLERRLPTLLNGSTILMSPPQLDGGQTTRNFHTSDRREFVKWAQNPLKVLQINIHLRAIKKNWDPTFSKEDFLLGAKMAAVNISGLVQQSDWRELRGLLTRKEFKRLQTEVGRIHLKTSQSIFLLFLLSKTPQYLNTLYNTLT